MTVIANEEKKMDGVVKTYLEIYEEHIKDYKQYKLEKIAVSIEMMEAQNFGDLTN
ncbi:hypothetical protein [Planomicrobium sp. MB-3u-38]|uniref:hypothetical protein n=1 Tax=Planomicrobium sp. MB-3u-38 TaxID=2058318 RepID=UPI0018EC887E|nr:hypothetical protein [Planomicrobium sp. MB-3u-38]